MIRVKSLGVLLVATMVLNVTTTKVQAQEKESRPADKLPEATATPPKEESSVTDHTIKIAGQTIPYKDRKSTRLNSSHGYISYAVFCLKKKKKSTQQIISSIIKIFHTSMMSQSNRTRNFIRTSRMTMRQQSLQQFFSGLNLYIILHTMA